MPKSDLRMPEDFIRAAPPGNMIYAPGTDLRDGRPLIALLVRELPEIVAAWPPNPLLQLRASVFVEPAAVVVVTMLHVADRYYEAWWNYHAPGAAADFALAAAQTAWPIIFYSASAAQRALRTTARPLGRFFQEAIVQAQSRPPWAMAAFAAAMAAVGRAWPTAERLWRALGPREEEMSALN